MDTTYRVKYSVNGRTPAECDEMERRVSELVADKIEWERVALDGLPMDVQSIGDDPTDRDDEAAADTIAHWMERVTDELEGGVA